MRELGFSLAGLLVGFAVGTTGVGGGSLMTPALILFYGVSPALAVGTDLLYASISKGFAVILHGRNGSVDWKLVGLQAMGSVPAVLLVLWWLHDHGRSPGMSHTIKVVLSVAIIVTAGFTLFQEATLRWIHSHHGAVNWLSQGRRRGLTILIGALVGVVVTISSVGAGVIGLMLLMSLYPGHSPIRIVGSDLAHAVLVTAIAGLGHATLGSVDYQMLAALLVGAFPGIWLGTRIGFRVDSRLLKRILAAILIFIGATTLARAAVNV